MGPKEGCLEISVLIDADYLWHFQEDEVRRGQPGEPVALKTRLGWVLSGPSKGDSIFLIDCKQDITVNPVFVNKFLEFVPEPPKTEDDLHKLWDLDTVGIRPTNQVHTDIVDSIEFTGDRYRTKLPWKVGHKELSSNYSIAVSRLKRQLNKLQRNPDILSEYDNIIQEHEKAGIIEKVVDLEPSGSSPHYLPHRTVVRQDAGTTKVCIVYDASCKDKPGGVSLNDCLHVGPSMTPMILIYLLPGEYIRWPWLLT